MFPQNHSWNSICSWGHHLIKFTLFFCLLQDCLLYCPNEDVDINVIEITTSAYFKSFMVALISLMLSGSFNLHFMGMRHFK